MTDTQITQADADPDWSTASDLEIAATVAALKHLSPNRNATLIQEMCRRFTNRTDATPVAWMVIFANGRKIVLTEPDPEDWLAVYPLYTHPPATDVAALVEAAKAVQAWEDATEDGELPTAIAIALSAALAPFTKGQNDA